MRDLGQDHSNHWWVMESYRRKGYVSATVCVSPSIYNHPEERERVLYLHGHPGRYKQKTGIDLTHDELRRKLEKVFDIMLALRNAPGLERGAFSLDHFVLADDAPALKAVKDTMRLRWQTKRRKRGPVAKPADIDADNDELVRDDSLPRAGEYGTDWYELHRKEWHPEAFSPPTVDNAPARYRYNDFYLSLPPREKDCVLLQDYKHPLNLVPKAKHLICLDLLWT
jgi:hypothetical protein